MAKPDLEQLQSEAKAQTVTVTLPGSGLSLPRRGAPAREQGQKEPTCTEHLLLLSRCSRPSHWSRASEQELGFAQEKEDAA